jgi:hypothetical protein
MTCKKCRIKPVWKFTNQTQLCKQCFEDYIERKVFRTIRKFSMLSGREIKLKKESSLNHNVLKKIFEKKFSVMRGNEFSSENLSQVAEDVFGNVLNGKFTNISALNPKKPLYDVSDAELELYAKLKLIKGKKRVQDKKLREFFEKFMVKNPDLEINIVNASGMLD